MKFQVFLISILLPVFLCAQQVPHNTDFGQASQYPSLTTSLENLAQLSKSSLKRQIEFAKEEGIVTSEDRIYVEIVRGSITDIDMPLDKNLLEKELGITFNSIYKNVGSAWIKPGRILELGAKLPKNHVMMPVSQPILTNQGPSLMNSDDYQGSNIGGKGIKIAIIDIGFIGLTNARMLGAAPPSSRTTNFNFVGGRMESTDEHGRLCLETVYDHAPNAEYYLMKISGKADAGLAISKCIELGVDIISFSIHYFNTGWADNTGTICAAAAEAADNGILFFAGAGNQQEAHWQGAFNDPDNDNVHSWSGNDEANTFRMETDQRISTYLQWNGPSQTNYYDVYLYDLNTGELLDKSTNSSSFEYFSYTADQARDVYLVVRARRSNPPEFEIFNHSRDLIPFEHYSERGSTASPSNSTRKNVISVGAVEWAYYEFRPGTNQIAADYSSRGPTNSGNQAPDIVAPTGTSTTTGSFIGTSCSVPNVAGMAAAFWSAHSNLSANGVREILIRKAELYKDWGETGVDDIYGHGGVYLHDYHRKNRYIFHEMGNIFSNSAIPYYSVATVDNSPAVFRGRRMIHLDPLDRVGSSGTLLSKPMLYTSVGSTLIKSGTPLSFVQKPKSEPITLVPQYEPVNFSMLADASNSRVPERDQFMLFPNPVIDMATINYNIQNEGPVLIQILDSNGSVISTIEQQLKHLPGQHQIQLSTITLDAGIYFCRLQMEEKSRTIKFVVSK